MNHAASVVRQARWEQKMFWRNPAAAAFTFAFPLVFLVIFIAINGNSTVHLAGGTAKFAQYYVPAIVAFSVMSACYTNLAFSLSIRRERGVLKRVRGTPLPPVDYMGGAVGGVIVVSLILTALVMILGITVYGVTFPNRYLGLVITVVSGAFAFSALGVAVSTIVPNEDAAPAIINFILFPLLFISGTFGPISDSSFLAKIAVLFPVRHMIKTMIAVFDPFAKGTGIQLGHIGILLLWGVVGIGVSLRRFRWEPRSS
jgi:ABC-2 type transport system permease protein